MKLASFDQVLAQLDRLTHRTGLGWALSHCAQSIEYAVRGFPTQKSGVFQKTIGRWVLGRFLARGEMSHDLMAPIPGAELINPGTTLDDGKLRLREAIALFRSHAGAFAPHFAYGQVDRGGYEAVQSMHVANHLSS